MEEIINFVCFQVKDSYRKFVRQGRCLGHSTPVVHVDWSQDSSYIQTNSADNEVMVWLASSSRQVRDIDMIRDIDWASGDCVVQWNSLGVWGETNDSADPRTASLSRSHDVLVVGDSWAKVKLYSSPACQPRSLNHSYTGHSSQVCQSINATPNLNFQLR